MERLGPGPEDGWGAMQVRFLLVFLGGFRVSGFRVSGFRALMVLGQGLALSRAR